MLAAPDSPSKSLRGKGPTIVLTNVQVSTVDQEIFDININFFNCHSNVEIFSP